MLLLLLQVAVHVPLSIGLPIPLLHNVCWAANVQHVVESSSSSVQGALHMCLLLLLLLVMVLVTVVHCRCMVWVLLLLLLLHHHAAAAGDHVGGCCTLHCTLYVPSLQCLQLFQQHQLLVQVLEALLDGLACWLLLLQVLQQHCEAGDIVSTTTTSSSSSNSSSRHRGWCVHVMLCCGSRLPAPLLAPQPPLPPLAAPLRSPPGWCLLLSCLLNTRLLLLCRRLLTPPGAAPGLHARQLCRAEWRHRQLLLLLQCRHGVAGVEG
jgi:hypothetical protein